MTDESSRDETTTPFDPVNGVDPRPGDPDYPYSIDPLLQLMGEDAQPLPEGTDMDRLIAAYDVIGRCGARDFEVGYDDEEPEGHQWYAEVEIQVGPERFRTEKVTRQTEPVQAAEKLARRLLNGATCTHCGKVMSLVNPIMVGVPFDICAWIREGKRWERGCRDSHEEGLRQKKIVEDFLSRTGVKKKGT